MVIGVIEVIEAIHPESSQLRTGRKQKCSQRFPLRSAPFTAILVSRSGSEQSDMEVSRQKVTMLKRNPNLWYLMGYPWLMVPRGI